MDGQRQIDTGGDFLKRSVALLLSLANICQSIADRSWPVRCLILWILGPAEQIAWDRIPEHVVAPFVEGKRYSRYHALYFAWLFKKAAFYSKRELRREARFARKWAKFKVRESGNDPLEPVGLLLPERGEGRHFRRGGAWWAAFRLLQSFRAAAPRLDSS